VVAQPRKANDPAGFFYVGNDSSRIEFLIRTFKTGYAVEDVQKAILNLKRLGELDELPGIIITDAGLGAFQLKELHDYLGANSILRCIPFLLEASGLLKKEVDAFSALKIFDDFVFLDKADTGKMLTTVKFLQNIKSRVNEQRARQRNQATKLFDKRIITKRVFDLIISALTVIILSPIFMLIALIIKLESPGPVLYVSKRAGRGYRVFNFYKFRTMGIGADEKVSQLSHLNKYNSNPEESPVFFKVINDTRITRIGAFLRNTSLDELPQFFNVLAGNMSLVGNRPLPLYEAAKLTTDEWAHRFIAPAGITGLWQINKKGREETSMEERIRLDIDYSYKYSFIYDLWIIANTPSALIQKSNT
jgi:lipopolysaccharide/colanic/teichoic acid biosynthesis glycosyltransferase